ncbi:winged helix DNA-binding domain-containing protein [Conexibacter sp. CPCC 206217]|uniref:winged helix DNA-binding domain-containing protein n=1 Tax=Conexibacter sp. CPCC 206217 TaxID=3064574 RepID=UPI00272922B0|nr:winged helix DNA-binding domain-containing protein [Conexibacter sp. CPCC 206217]MDO8210558.1 winged helix DNA-binding domain-containing protein [Conexibacter sp. CPCC 206217]
MRLISDDERRARLGVRHALAAPTASVEEAVAAVVCLHATEPANVHLSAFARSGAAREQIDRALYEDRTVVRQLAMRRTVFAFPRDLLPAARGSASARVAAQLAARLAKEVRANGLAEDGEAWVRDACAAVLAEVRDQPATTAQLRAAIPALDLRLVTAPGRRWGGEVPIAPRVLATLAAGGAIVRGRNDAGWKVSRPFWTATEEWLGAPLAMLDERAGYAELVARWLARFGPGTEADVVWWLGATKGAVRRALADVGAVAVQLADGSPAWLHPLDTEEVVAPAPWAALLPALDPTTMGWKARGFYLGEHAARIVDRNGNAGPTAWWDGRIVGGWTQTDDGAVVVVPAEPIPAAAEQALAAAAERLTDWLAGDVVRTIYQSPLVRALDARGGGDAGLTTAR